MQEMEVDFEFEVLDITVLPDTALDDIVSGALGKKRRSTTTV
ncbi:hypothetical protein GCM10022254_06390 [Actinomadura meridiana]|uniref:Uncharacterized protein n=1 Tax=Actinomadura meridiana TaxID=559626 RepID=A0ABP8BU71_9ACTN